MEIFMEVDGLKGMIALFKHGHDLVGRLYFCAA
jgi:hypothetical protein